MTGHKCTRGARFARNNIIMRGLGIDIRVVATIIINVPSFDSVLICKIIGISEIIAVVFAALESMLALSVAVAIAIAA